MAKKARRINVLVVYDNGAGRVEKVVTVPARFWASHAMRELPYGARLLEQPRLVREV